MRRNIFYTALIVLGLAFAVWASSTQGDWSVGGNLAVTGTSVQTGAITATGGVVGDITGDVTGDITGDITGDVTGDINAAIVEADTLKPGSGTAFNLRAYDGQDDADLNIYDVSATNDVSATTFTGALTGNVTGNVTGDVTGDLTGVAIQTVLYKGNLPAAAAGNKNEIYANGAVDSVWISTGAAWTALLP